MVTSADPTAVSESAFRIEPSEYDDPMCRLSAQLWAPVIFAPALPGSGKGGRGDREAKPDGSNNHPRFSRLPDVQPSNGSLPFMDLSGIHACSETYFGVAEGSTVRILRS